jgi:hypothetical protein
VTAPLVIPEDGFREGWVNCPSGKKVPIKNAGSSTHTYYIWAICANVA